MKIAIMQPYVFPYVGYFQLINHVDKWVVFDDTQYISKGWINRNRILHPEEKKAWQYFTIPVKKHSLGSRITEIEINDSIRWKEELLGKLTSYKKKAPYYKDTIEFLNSCFADTSTSLSEWIVNSLDRTCQYLDLPFDCCCYSKLDFYPVVAEHAGQWALKIADAMGADEYINPSGGYKIFKEKEFQDRNIKLRFLQPELKPYSQKRKEFVSGLSIIDLMMWNDKADIKNMLNEFKIVSSAELMEFNND